MSGPLDEMRVVPPEGSDDESAREYGRQLAMDGLLEALLRDRDAQVTAVQASGDRRGSSLRLRTRSSSLSPAIPRVRFWNWPRLTGVAAALLIATGAALLWLPGTGPLERTPVVNENDAERETLLRAVEDWEEALSAVQAPVEPDESTRSPEVKPESPEDVLETARREESEEAERFIRARRDFVLRQLRRFEPKRPPVDLSDDEDAPEVPAAPERPALAYEDKAEVGQVLAADEGGAEGTLFRATGGGQRRLPVSFSSSSRMPSIRASGRGGQPGI